MYVLFLVLLNVVSNLISLPVYISCVGNDTNAEKRWRSS